MGASGGGKSNSTLQTKNMSMEEKREHLRATMSKELRDSLNKLDTEVDERVSRGILNALVKLQEDYPDEDMMISSINLDKMEAIASMSHNGDLNLNSTLFDANMLQNGMMDAKLRTLTSDNWLTGDDSITSLVNHELGHREDFYLAELIQQRGPLTSTIHMNECY